MKRQRTSENDNSRCDTLRLVLEPLARPVRRRRLGQHVCLDVAPGNKVFGSVNGRSCTVQLDSGSGTSFIFFSLAKKLCLLTGEARTEKQLFHLWVGTKEVEVNLLDEVVVTLEGQVEVRTPLRVLPKCLEKHYDPEDLVLGGQVLRRGGAVQTFGDGGSRLYLRRPKCLKASTRRQRAQKHPGGQTYSFWVRGPPDESRLMEVLLDTGAEEFYVSSNTRAEILTRGTEHAKAKAPRRVSLDLGSGRCLQAERLEVVPQEEVDFVMGEALLYLYEAVLDYSRYSLTLTVDGRHLRVNLGMERGGLH